MQETPPRPPSPERVQNKDSRNNHSHMAAVEVRPKRKGLGVKNRLAKVKATSVQQI